MTESILWHGTIAAVFTSLFAGLGGFLIFAKNITVMKILILC